MENVSEKLFDILRTKFKNPKIKTFDANGKETMDMDNVDMLSFDFEASGRNYGPVVILISAKDNLEIYYGDNTSRSLEPGAKKKWQGLIEHLSNFARRNRLGFSLKHISELKYDLSNITDVAESYKRIFEGYYGTRKTSYNNQGKAKIIIKHSRAIGEEDARYRNISALFIENADGERFKLPFKKLAGARAMARHVTEGGTPYDLFGVHISEMVKDINTLGGFVRRSRMYEDNDEAMGLIETGRTHYTNLRKSLNQIAGKRGYHTYKENWEPSEITETDKNVDSLRKLFTERSVNARIEEALPLLARLEELAEQQKANEASNLKQELLAKYTQTGDPKDAEAARQAGASEIDLNRAWNARPEASGIQNRGGYETMGPMGWMVTKKEPKMKEVDEFEQWTDEVVEGTWTTPESSQQLEALQKWLSKPQPIGIDALNATEALSDIIGDDDLYDALDEIAADDPEADARPAVIQWISKAIKTMNFKNPQTIKNLRTAIQGVREGMDKELDADTPVKLRAGADKDAERYATQKKVLSTIETKEQEIMKELSDYMDDIEGTQKIEEESVEEIMESVEDDGTDMKALLERTNYLLRK